MKAAVLNDYDTSLTRPEFVSLPERSRAKDRRVPATSSFESAARAYAAPICTSSKDFGATGNAGHAALHHGTRKCRLGRSGRRARYKDVKVGDPVICHPLLSRGETLAARRGNDMHAGGAFPGIDSNGGYAELLKTSERAVVKLPQTLAPKDVAPYADAGLTAYHVAKKAARPSVAGSVRGGDRCRRPRPYRDPGAWRRCAAPVSLRWTDPTSR